MNQHHDLGPYTIALFASTHESVFADAKADSYVRQGNLFNYPEHGVAVHIARPAKDYMEPNDLLVVPRALYADYADEGSDLEAARDQVIADVTGRTVIGITTPGFKYGGTSKASWRQVVDSARGEGQSLVSAQSEAIRQVMLEHDWHLTDKNVGMLGYCMGATVAAKLFPLLNEQLGEQGVSDLTIVESPNEQARKLTGANGLRASMLDEVSRPRVDRYLEWNDRYGLVQPYDREVDDFKRFNPERKELARLAQHDARFITGALFLAAMKGFAQPLALYAQESSIDTKVNIWRANNSTVTPQVDSERSVRQFNDADIDVRLHVMEGDDHHHPVFQSLPHVALLAHINEKSLDR